MILEEGLFRMPLKVTLQHLVILLVLGWPVELIDVPCVLCVERFRRPYVIIINSSLFVLVLQLLLIHIHLGLHLSLVLNLQCIEGVCQVFHRSCLGHLVNILNLFLGISAVQIWL